MTTKTNRPIGDPFTKVSETGKIGGAKTAELQNVLQANPQDGKASREEEELKKQTVYLPKWLARRVKNHATNTDSTISDITVEALKLYLEKMEG